MAGETKRLAVIIALAAILELHHGCQSRETQQLVRENHETIRLHREEAQAFINADAKLNEARTAENDNLLKRMETLEASVELFNKLVTEARARQQVINRRVEELRRERPQQ